VASRDFLDMDNVMWECDYPHSDSTWPMAPETLSANLAGMSDHDLDRVTHLNAMRHFNYDPFTVLGGKEECTVGALRARAVGHDVSIQSKLRAGVAKSGTLAVDLLKVGGSSGD